MTHFKSIRVIGLLGGETFKIITESTQLKVRNFGLWCLTPLSTIFPLYRGGHFHSINDSAIVQCPNVPNFISNS